MSSQGDRLREIIESGQPADLVPFFKELTEPERRALHARAQAAFKDQAASPESRAVAHLAFFATSTPREISRDAHHQDFGRSHANRGKRDGKTRGHVCVDMIEQVRPDCADAIIEILFKGNDEYYFGWTLAFDLFLRGLADPTGHPKFHRGLYENLCDPFGQVGDHEHVVVSFVSRFSDIVLPWIYQLFELPEFEGRSSYDHQDWVHQFDDLVKAELVDPHRLTDICVRGLRGAAKPRSAKFYFDVLDELGVELELETLAELCGAANPNTVKWAVRALSKRVKEEGFPADAVQRGLTAAAANESTAAAKAALKLAARVEKRHGASAATVAEAAIQSVDSEIQELGRGLAGG